jgi:hypothetical protein
MQKARIDTSRNGMLTPNVFSSKQERPSMVCSFTNALKLHKKFSSAFAVKPLLLKVAVSSWLCHFFAFVAISFTQVET